MGDYISLEAALAEQKMYNVYASTEMAIPVKALRAIPAADVVEVVRCRECKHRIVYEHYGERGYLKLKAMCKLDTGDPYELGRNAEDDDWFCADGERKDDGEP